MNKKQTAAIVTIVAMIAAVGTIGIIAGAPAADAQQRLAPGQGAFGFGNPGQCQNTLRDFGVSQESAHDFCH